ncbi:MAG TPA: hypothetical protein VFQ41_12820 [Candidatus Angelobacter sp.]|nr:hypothetical protein [Candidatus Angelobacter sp.]
MADQEKDKQMDKMLASLLAGYSSAEPRPGLETRILANLRDAESREASRGWWGFKWLWAGAALAAVIVAGVLIGGRRHAAPPTQTVVQTAQPAVQQPVFQQPIVQQPAIQSSVPAVVGQERVIHRQETLAPVRQQNAMLALSQRPAVFPTPTPLSEQERLLLSYYSHTPREEVIAQSHPDEPPVVGDQDQTETIPDLMHIPQKASNTR